MTDFVIAFHREQKMLAKIHLHLRPDGSVFAHSWHGDLAVREVIKPLPGDDQQLRETWSAYITKAARIEGFELTKTYEGESLALMDDGYPGE